MYRHLFTKEKYFRQVRRLIETRIPPLLETTTRPPTPLAGELLNMVARPLQAVQVIFFCSPSFKRTQPYFIFFSGVHPLYFQELQDRSLTTEMMHQLCQEFLSPDPSDQVE